MSYVALNNASSTLAAALGNNPATDTSIVVQAGHGARFAVGSNYSYITLEDSGGNIEICKLTARSSDMLTVVRAQDGTAVRSWSIGDIIECRPCAAALNDYGVASQINTSTATAIADADEIGFVDASLGVVLAKITWANIKAAIWGALPAAISGATSKTTPVDADMLPLYDSAATTTQTKLSWANLKATAKTYFDTLYAKVGAIGSSGLTMSTGKLLGRYSASTGAVQEITISTGLSLDGSGNLTAAGGVTTFNTRSGAVTLSSTDVTDALTFTPVASQICSFSSSADWTGTLDSSKTFAWIASNYGYGVYHIVGGTGNAWIQGGTSILVVIGRSGDYTGYQVYGVSNAAGAAASFVATTADKISSLSQSGSIWKLHN